jgi:hypothetical protein
VKTRAVAVLVALFLVSAACGHRRGVTTATADEPGPILTSPFLVEDVPEGFRLEVAGRGTTSQAWGGDSYGSDEPFTVLAPPGADPGGDEAVVVSVTGYEDYEGGLDQASAGYLADSTEHFRMDGRAAVYAPATTQDPYGPRSWDDLVVARSDDLAVRVTAAGAGRERLVDIARRVEPDEDTTRAPRVPDPPDGLVVVGSVGVGVQLALTPRLDIAADFVPGLDVAYAAGWVTPDAPDPSWPPDPGSGTRGGVAAPPATPPPGPPPRPLPMITLVAYPGDTTDDLAALAGLVRIYPHTITVSRTTVAGRPAAVIEIGSGEVRIFRSVITHAPWGDLLMAGASGAPAEAPTVDQLAAMLASARAATPAEWDSFVAGAAAG